MPLSRRCGGKGLATRLLNEWFQTAAAENLQRLFLEVREGNLNAKPFTANTALPNAAAAAIITRCLRAAAKMRCGWRNMLSSRYLHLHEALGLGPMWL